uniref:myosin-1-like isoform X1 n=1 Tax=Styela clava TaxID=7725 RepID=UPI00193A4B04|nr:myosin-1-like isoform X1 [Styela clava]
MSLSHTPVRTPLREINVPVNQTPKSEISKLTPFKAGWTPKTSPGPALLLAIRLSAKKELIKNYPSLEYKDIENCVESKSPSNVIHFRNLLLSETERITKTCDKWENILMEIESDEDVNVKIHDTILGDMRTTVGQGRLIMRERFHQFSGLVDNCEFGTSEKPVTCQDLQGFWDMIYFQVEDVDAKFELLNKCQAADWDSNILAKPVCKKNIKKIVKRKTNKKDDSKKSEIAKKRREDFAKKRAEARKRLAVAKAGMMQAQQQENTGDNNAKLEKERVTFDAGFFKVDSPLKSPHLKVQTPAGKRLTPHSTSMQKQTCTPGSITKSLSLNSAAKTSPLVLENSTMQNGENFKKINNSASNLTKPEISKRLEFVGNNTCTEFCKPDEDCIVEILMDDPEQSCEDSKLDVDGMLPESENITNIHAENVAASLNHTESFEIIENIVDGSNNDNCEQSSLKPDLDSQICANVQPESHEKIKLTFTTDNVHCDVNEDSPTPSQRTIEEASSEIQVPEKFSHFNSPLASNLSETDTLLISISPPTPFCNASEKHNNENTSDNTSKFSMLSDTNEQDDNSTKSCQEVSISLPNNDNLTEMNEVDQKDMLDSSTAQPVLSGGNLFSPFPQDITSDNVNEEASNLSIFIDEATKNIEKMSEILCPIAETPLRPPQFGKHAEFLDCSNRVANTPELATQQDVKNEISPNKATLQAVLLETMDKMKFQMETLQKLNLNYLRSPNKELEQLQMKVDSLQSEKCILQKQLEDEKNLKKENQPHQNTLSDSDNIRRLVFQTQDELNPEDESNDILYKPHYFRLLARVKVLETELKVFNDLQPDLLEIKPKITNTYQKLCKKEDDLKHYSDAVKKHDEDLRKSLEDDNKELIVSRKTIEELKLELDAATEKLFETKKLAEEYSSSIESVQHQFDSIKTEKDKVDTALIGLSKENTSHAEENTVLQEKLDTLSKQLEEQTLKSEFLEGKLGHVGKEVESAFTEFNSVIQKRDEFIKCQQKQVEELTDTNNKLCQDCKSLQDKIETLEYVEEEMRLVQEQLSETEQSLEISKNEQSRLDILTQDLKSEVETLNKTIEKQQSEYGNLQEELDVSKAEAHFMVQQREEELGYGNSGMKHILTMMHELHSRLCGMIRPEIEHKSKSDYMTCPDDVMMTPYVRPPKDLIVDTVLRSNVSQDNKKLKADTLDNQPTREGDAINGSPIPKDKDSIIARVDEGAEVFQSIINACAEVQLQFQKDIENLEFRNSVLVKQLASTKEKLFDFNKEENELEQMLRKRIEKLMKEGEEKSNKIQENSDLLRMLSDQNMELSKYKVKYEELFGEFKTSKRHRQTKRRSSSAGSLKFLS